MFNISGTEIIVILLLALVVLGPEKLPDAMRKAGRTYSELKRMSTSFQTEMRDALDEPMKEMRDTADLLRNAATFDPKLAATKAVKDAATKPTPAAEAPADDAPVSDADAAVETVTVEDAEPRAVPTPEDDLISRTLSGGAAPVADAPLAADPETATRDDDAGDGPGGTATA